MMMMVVVVVRPAMASNGQVRGAVCGVPRGIGLWVEGDGGFQVAGKERCDEDEGRKDGYRWLGDAYHVLWG